VSCGPGDWLVFAACGAVLAAVAVAARVPATVLWRRGRFVLAPVLLVAAVLPLVREDGVEIAAAVAAKALIGVVAALLVTATTTFPATLRGLEAMRVPKVFVLIAAFMYRYLFVIADEVARMRQALAARGHRPRHALQAGAIGRVASALFLRSFQRGERVYLAMVSRGYRGSMPWLQPLAFARADAVFVAVVVLPLLTMRMAA
jgi:cobalt/nickel transport system permease protein